MRNKLQLQILLVEDDPLNQKYAIRILEQLGHTVCLADTGTLAIGMYKNNEFDLVLIDFHLPDINGMEVTNSLHQLDVVKRRAHTIPIIAVSSINPSDAALHFNQANVDAFLFKPFRPDELEQIITEVIDKRHPDKKTVN